MRPIIHFEDVKITHVEKTTSKYNSKKKKHIDYKKPKITTKILHEEDSCYDLGELYEIIKFHTDKQGQYGNEIKVSFDTGIEY